MKRWEKEKAEVLKQMNEAMQLYDDNQADPVLIAALLRIRESAATANKNEWEKEGYYSWWKIHRPGVFPPEGEDLKNNA